MRRKYHTLEEYRAANALRQREWRRKRRVKLGFKAVGKRGRRPKHVAAKAVAKAAPKTVTKPKTRTKRGLELAIN